MTFRGIILQRALRAIIGRGDCIFWTACADDETLQAPEAVEPEAQELQLCH